MNAQEIIEAIARLDLEDEILAAAEESMIGMGDEGICLACGESRGGCEPDARRYPCESCGKRAVYGAPELVLYL